MKKILIVEVPEGYENVHKIQMQQDDTGYFLTLYKDNFTEFTPPTENEIDDLAEKLHPTKIGRYETDFEDGLRRGFEKGAYHILSLLQ